MYAVAKISFCHLTNFKFHVKQNYSVFDKEQTDYRANGIGPNHLGHLFCEAIAY
jgi:hypothetical protein